MTSLQDIQNELEAGRIRSARYRMAELIQHAPTSAHCHAVSELASKMDGAAAELQPLRLALLSNFTTAPLKPLLIARALAGGIHLRIWEAEFDTWRQQLLKPGEQFREFRPDWVFLLLTPDVLFPECGDAFLALTNQDLEAILQHRLNEIAGLLAAFRRHSSAAVAITTLPLPRYAALGVLDAQRRGLGTASGQVATIVEFNRRLHGVIREVAGGVMIDLDQAWRYSGVGDWHDARMWSLAGIPWTLPACHALAQFSVAILRAAAGLTRKVLVTDLDNTLWGGILGESGPEGIQIGGSYPGSVYVEFQRTLLALSHRGVLLAINSKNDADTVLPVLQNHASMVLHREHFSAVRINWQDKAENLRELAAELNLGLDSFVFVDDDPAECERVRQALPQVLTLHLHGEPFQRPDQIRKLDVFDSLIYGAEDRRRTELYRNEREREQLRQNFQSLEDFYRSLAMRLEIHALSSETIERAADLSRRTNQFNFTTRRYSVADLERLSAQGARAYTARLRDRFGDNGIISLVLLIPGNDAWEIDTFLMSCRVLQRSVDDALLAFMAGVASAEGARWLIGSWIPTARNSQLREWFPHHGFEPWLAPAGTCPGAAATRWRLPLPTRRLAPEWFEFSFTPPALAATMSIEKAFPTPA